MAKMGRPKIVFSDEQWKMFETLCKVQSSREEICAFFDIDEKTLNRLIKKKYKKTFSLVFDQKRKVGFGSLRSRQYKAAMEGDRTLLIWLGKQWLGQADKQDLSIPDGDIKIEYHLHESRPIKPTG